MSFFVALRIGHETKKDIPMLMRRAKGAYVALTKGQEWFSKS